MKTKRILIIDDEVSITRTMKVNLERLGLYTVRTENYALNALAAAHEFKPDFIILDVMMPDMDGGAVTEQFKLHSELKHVPVLFLTAIMTQHEVGINGSIIGGQKFMAKPVNLESLRMYIAKQFELHELV